MVTYTKRQVIDHIHRLMVIQFKRTGSMQWKCILRDGQIGLIAPDCVRPMDIVLIDYIANPDCLPLRTLIHEGVDENWDALDAIDMTI